MTVTLVDASNYTRLCGLLVDTGRDVLKDLLEKRLAAMYNYCSRTKFRQCGAECGNDSIDGEHCSFVDVLAKVKKELFSLKALQKQQKKFLYPDDQPKEGIVVDDLDASLLCLLLRSVSGLTPFESNLWIQDSKGASHEECIARLHHRRNFLVGHAFRPTITTELFDNLWSSITTDLMRLSKIYTQLYYDTLKAKPIDPCVHEQYIRDLCKWQDSREYLPRLALDWSKFVPIILFNVSILVAYATYRTKFIKCAFELSYTSIEFRAHELNEISTFFNVVVLIFGLLVIPYYTAIRSFYVRLLFVITSFVFFRASCAMSVIVMINYIKNLTRAQRYLLLTSVTTIILIVISDHYHFVDFDFM